MTKGLSLPDSALDSRLYCGVSEDFRSFVTGGEWTDLIADSGSSCAAGDTEDGVLAIATGGTDNNEAAVFSTKKVFLLGADKPHYFECLMQYAEANTDDANIFLGFSSALAANMMVDNGAGPAASFSGAGFYKVDTDGIGNLWGIVVSLGSTQTKVPLTATASHNKQAQVAGGTPQHYFRVEFQPKNTTQGDFMFYIDDVLVYKVTDYVFTSAAAMAAGAYVKAGGANSETINVDLLTAYKRR